MKGKNEHFRGPVFSPEMIICSHVSCSNKFSFSISEVVAGKGITSEFSVTTVLECLRIFYVI